MEYEFKCTVHNFQYGFGKMPKGDWEPALLGGSITDKDEPYTATALKVVMNNIENATKPE